MSKRKIRAPYIPNVWAEVGTVASILFLFTHCSPMNPSVDKTNYTGKTIGTSPVTPAPVVPQHVFYIVNKKVKIDESESRSIGSPLTGTGEKIALSAAASENPDEFARFKKEGKADIALEGTPSAESLAFMKVTIPAGEETLADLSDFDLKLRRVSSTSWELSISAKSMSHPAVQAMLEGLTRIALELKAPSPEPVAATPHLAVYPATEEDN